MALSDRLPADILRGSMRNLQEIVRSEVRLRKTEFVDEAARAKSSVEFLVAGAVTTLFAALFLLLTMIFAQALVTPIWAVTLILGTTMAMVASITLTAGVKRFKFNAPPYV